MFHFFFFSDNNDRIQKPCLLDVRVFADQLQDYSYETTILDELDQ